MEPANEVVSGLEAQMKMTAKHIKADERVRIIYGGVFGTMHALRVVAYSDNLLSIVARDSEGNDTQILAPAGQCSFKIVIVPKEPTAPDVKSQESSAT